MTPATWPAAAADLLHARPELHGVGLADVVEVVTAC